MFEIKLVDCWVMNKSSFVHIATKFATLLYFQILKFNNILCFEIPKFCHAEIIGNLMAYLITFKDSRKLLAKNFDVVKEPSEYIDDFVDNSLSWYHCNLIFLFVGVVLNTEDVLETRADNVRKKRGLERFDDIFHLPPGKKLFLEVNKAS